MQKIDNRLEQAPKDTVKQGWVNRLSPDFAWPYFQLMRADRPIGTWLLLWPCLWAIALASHWQFWVPEHWQFYLPNIFYLILFSLGAFIMRGAGCVINDLADRKYDAMVERTRGRPLPSGRVSVMQALIFLAVLCLLGLLILIQLNIFTIGLGFLSLGLIILYPFMKRITYWPQFVLGLTFNWGALMGWSAVTGGLEWPALLLYGGGIFWTLGYDTIYAHQDKEDDALIGIKSTALRLAENTPRWMIFFYGSAFMLFTLAGYGANMGVLFYGGCVFAAAHLIWQIKKLDINDGDKCLCLFKSNRDFGLILFLAILGGHLDIMSFFS